MKNILPFKNDNNIILVHPCDKGDNGNCSQICNKDKTEAVCTCRVGFELATDGSTCKKGKLFL